MYLFTLIKCDLIANDFLIERCRDIPMNTRAPVCTFLLCNLPKCVVPNSKQHVGSPLLLIETSIHPHVLNIENLSLNVRKHQMLFDRTLQAAMGLLDGVKNGQYGGNMTTWNLSSNSGGTTMLRCGRASSKMMTSNSLMKAWKVARVTVLCSITWWTKPMSGDMSSVMLTFLPRGATTRRTRSPNGARPLLLRVKMLNPDSSIYTWRWWTPVMKEGIDDVAQTGKCEYCPTMWRIENVAGLCWDDFFHTVHRCPFQQSWWWWACFEGAGLWLSLKLSLKLSCLGSEPPVPDQPRRWWWKAVAYCSSLMKACMSSVSLMLWALPSGGLCTRPSANRTRMMLRAVWYGMPRRAASSW